MSLLDKASLVVTPNAYKESKLYSVVPSDGSGDMTVVRATTATRINSANLVEVVPRNLFTDSDGLISTYPVRGGNIIQASTPISGFANSVEFQNNLTSSFLYKTFATTTGTTYVISVFVQMNDNSTPVPSLNQNLGDFSLILSGEGPSNLNVERIGTSSVYRISGRVTSINTNMNYGVVKYNTQSAKAFKVAGYQLEFGTAVSEFLITTTRLNIPRIDYTNGSCPSLLVEPQRTNLFTYSDQFDNIAWSKFQATVTANNTTSPEGISTADKLESSTNGTAVLFRTALTGATASTISVYAKAGTNDILDIGFTNVTDFTVKANLTTGTITSATSGITGTITNAGNGWYRVTATRTMTASGTAFINSATTISGRFIYIWGGQLEVGAYATSYIPTIASSVTRNADVISKTGISSLIGQTEGTIFIDFNVNNLTSQTADPVIFSTSGTNYIRLSVARVISYFESNTVSIVSASNVIINGRNKIAVNYKNNDFSLYVNGVLVGSNNSGSVVAKSNFALNYIPTSIFDPSLFYNSIQLYKTKLTNAESIAITTL